MALTAFFASTSFAQAIIGKGIKGGLNIAEFKGDVIEDIGDIGWDIGSKVGIVIGAFLTYSINEKLAIQPEVLYSMKGAKVEYQYTICHHSNGYYKETFPAKGTWFLNYLDIPILARYSIASVSKYKLHIFAGPSLGFYLNGKAKTEIEEKSDENEEHDIESDDVNSPDWGFAFGAGVTLNQLSIDGRYSMGTTNITKEDDLDWQNKVISLMVGYQF